MQASELFVSRFSVIAATALIYALFAFLRAMSQLVINRDTLRRSEAEVKAWEERRQKAIQSRDIKLYERVQREQARIDRLKKDADIERMKASAVALLAWPILLTIIWRVTGDPPVALAPTLWGYERIKFSAWFIANTFWASVLLDRIASSLNSVYKARRKGSKWARRSVN